jgi:hypothetical protein
LWKRQARRRWHKKDSGNGSGNNNTAAAANTASYSFAFHTATDFTKLEELGIIACGFTTVIDLGANHHYCPTHEHFHILTPARAALFIVPERSGLYPVLEVHVSKSPTLCPITMSMENLASVTLTLHEFHCHMGHADICGLHNMVKKGVVTGIKLTDDKAGFCKGCAMGIIKCEPFPCEHSSPIAKTYWGKVFSDVWGPTPKESLGGKLYFVVFVDDKSDEVIVMGLHKKSDVFDAYKHYEAWVKVHRGTVAIGEWRTDSGGKFMSTEMETHFKNQGTHHPVTVHDSSAQNGHAELILQTLLAHGRAMLHLASLPAFLWLKAVVHTAWIRNRMETVNTISATLHKRAMGNKPDLSQLWHFGTNVWVKDEHTSKIDVQAKPCHWVGIDTHTKGHRIYWPGQRKVTIERNVQFEGEPEDTIYPSSVPGVG